MKKYKVTKPIPGFGIHDEYIGESILLRNEYLLENGFIEEIKEEETPKFKIGDKVVEESKFNNIGIDEFIIITSVANLNGDYVYNLQYGPNNYCNYLNENKIRLANTEELELYFNNN